MDDVDLTRYRPQYLDSILEVLEFLGFDWDYGPQKQSDHQAAAWAALDQFRRGERCFVCTCSRSSLQARTGQSLVYDGHCQGQNQHFEPAQSLIRWLNPRAGYPVLWTKDHRPSYAWASILDDERESMTHIVRGEDLRPATDLQCEIQAAWARVRGQPAWQIQFLFHPLLMDEDGKKLSKSADSESLVSWIQNGKTSEDIWLELSRRVDAVKKIPQPIARLRDWKAVWIKPD